MSIAPNAQASYHPRKINSRVPSMQYDAAVDMSGIYLADFGTPILSDENFILAAQDIAAAGTATTLLDDQADANFGRNVTLDLSGAGTPAVVVKGRDYLGQGMSETLTGNGTTTVQGKKAFMWIDSVSWALVAGTTMDIGWGDVLGLPYRTVAKLEEFSDSVLDATGWTFVAALVETTPSTATTADVRGTVNPNTTLDGVKRIVGRFIADKNNLHGNAQFSA